MLVAKDSVLVIIDARAGKGEPLAIAAGRPQLQWLLDAALLDSAESVPHAPFVLVVTDSEAVYAWCCSHRCHSDKSITLRTWIGDVGSFEPEQEEFDKQSFHMAREQFGLKADRIVMLNALYPLVTGSTVQRAVDQLTKTIAAQLETSAALRVKRAVDFDQSTYTVVHANWREMIAIATPEDVAIADLIQRQRVQAERLGKLPQQIDAVVFDFDGVFTDNRVWVTQAGEESVACHRGDGMGIGQLKKTGLPVLVLSKEPVPIVVHRCKKLGLECLHGVDDKLPLLLGWLAERNLSIDNTVYMGNDINDRECLIAAGCGVSPCDGHNDILPLANILVDKAGGHGAVRELCDLVVSKLNRAGEISR